METLRLVVLVVHILGFAALIGGLLAQVGGATKRVLPVMRDGIGTAFVTGIALVGILAATGAALDYRQVAVKLVIGIVLLVLVMANNRKSAIPQGLWAGLLVLSVVNVVVAVAWGPVRV